MRQIKLYTIQQISMAAVALTAVSARAQTQTPPSQPPAGQSTTSVIERADSLGEIVVTANRREQNLQKVGISVTALSTVQLRSLGVKQTTDIVAQVPGLKFNQYSPALTIFNIRGVSQNTYADQLEAPVAVYMDDTYVAALGASGVPTFDLQRAEVLRGPQGTLFGRNATGGLINFVSAPPTKSFEAVADVSGGTRSNFHASAAVSGPLAPDIQARLSATVNLADGYIKNSLGPDGGNQDNYAVRGQLAAQPLDSVKIRLIGRYAENHHEHTTATTQLSAVDADGRGYFLPRTVDFYGTCVGCDFLGYKAPADHYRVESANNPVFNRKVYGGQLRVDIDLGPGTVTSITDYLHLDKYYREDGDGTPNPIIDYETGDTYHQFSQELKYAGKQGYFRYTFGGYYLTTDTQFYAHIDSRALLGSEANPFFAYFTGLYKLDSYSLYAQGELELTRRLTATVGARYVSDRRSATYVQTQTGLLPVVFDRQTEPGLSTEHYKDYALRAALDFQLTNKTLFYISFNRGVKGPNFDTPSFQPFDVTKLPYRGETLYAYEAGVKSGFFDGRLRANLSAYIYDYKNYQAFLTFDFQTRTTNLPATARGLELEVTALPFDGLTLSGGLALEYSRVRGVILPAGRKIDTELPQAPSVSGNLVARYEHPVSPSLKVSLQFDATYTGQTYFTVAQEPVNREPAYGVGNIQVNIGRIDDRRSIGIFSRNVWNQQYRQYSADSSGIAGAYNLYAEPRWFGIQTSLHF